MVVHEDDIPDHLQSLPRVCPHCSSTNVKLRYFNNDKLTQPRFECYSCGKQFTLGGKVRAVKRNTKAKRKNKKNARTTNLQCAETNEYNGLVKFNLEKRHANRHSVIPVLSAILEAPPSKVDPLKKTPKTKSKEGSLVLNGVYNCKEVNCDRDQKILPQNIIKSHLLNDQNIVADVNVGNNDHLIKQFTRQEDQTLEVALTTMYQAKYPPKEALKSNLEENDLVIINSNAFEEDNATRNHWQKKRVKDITKAHLLNAYNFLLNIDMEKDDQSRRQLKTHRDRAKEVLQYIKKVLVDDGCDQVQADLQHMTTYNVAIVEEVFEAIETMHSQVESIDIKHISLWKMGCFEKKANWVKNKVMELASSTSPSKM